MRYGEVLLSYAEATYELNETISDEELNLSINKLRSRFSTDENQLPSLTNAFASQHGLDMREEIRRERIVEMAVEKLLYDDIIRWKRAEIELPKSIMGIKFDQEMYPKMVPGKDVMVDADGFVITQDKSTRSFDVSKHYLFPLPLREINLNTNLKQNPGWQ